MKEPDKQLLRPKEVIEWLGITRSEFYSLVDAKVITGRCIRTGGRPYYWKDQIIKKIIDPMKKDS
jgi:predicted DNA-binding transcriptional regulator AlpA